MVNRISVLEFDTFAHFQRPDLNIAENREYAVETLYEEGN
jgi:hypothetical protein